MHVLQRGEPMASWNKDYFDPENIFMSTMDIARHIYLDDSTVNRPCMCTTFAQFKTKRVSRCQWYLRWCALCSMTECGCCRDPYSAPRTHAPTEQARPWLRRYLYYCDIYEARRDWLCHGILHIHVPAYIQLDSEASY